MSTEATSPSPTKKKLGPTVITVLLTAVLTLMLLAFLIPAISSGPHQLPLAVAGPPEAIAAVEGKLSAASPEAFELHAADGTDSAIAMVENREAIGAITLDPAGATITVASGAGAPYAALLRNIASGMTAAGQAVTVNDVAPMAAADPAGRSRAGLSAV